jgi:3-phenylpropionate/trans-cinnamate dioxygenase ferredoxin subunit
MAKEIQWVKIAESINEIPFGNNGLAEVSADGKKICVGKWNGELFAFAPKCPHASGILKDGFIDALGNVVCPLHRYKFCMKNGRNVSGEGYFLKHWPVKIKEEGVFAGFDKSSLFSLFN